MKILLPLRLGKALPEYIVDICLSLSAVCCFRFGAELIGLSCMLGMIMRPWVVFVGKGSGVFVGVALQAASAQPVNDSAKYCSAFLLMSCFLSQ